MAKRHVRELIPDEKITSKIYFIRGLKVMIDEDLAEMYGIETKRLNEQVRRNPDRFPSDFMFQLTSNEYDNLRSQFATASWGGRRNLPFVFTEYGVLMLSSVLNSKTAIEVNIRIMRVYTRLRHVLVTHKDILIKLEKLESDILFTREKSNKQGEEIVTIFEVLRQLLNKTSEPRKKIGYKQKEEVEN
jgi:hypothetical protein